MGSYQQPENETVGAIVRDNALLVINDIKGSDQALKDAKESIDKRIEATVADINSLSESIARLNKEIVNLESTSGESGDLRDQRDSAVRTLSEYFEVKVYEDEKGRFVVNIEGAGSIVAGGTATEVEIGKVLSSSARPEDEGQVEIYFKEQA